LFKLDTFLQILPQIASHPLAILAYICVVVVWLVAALRSRRSKDFLKTLELLPEPDRSAFARRSGYRYDELAFLPQKQRLKLLTKRYRLFAFIVTVLAIVILGIVVLIVYQNSSGLNAAFNQLHKKSEDADAAITAFRIKVEAARASSDEAGRLLNDQELNRIGQELRKAADEFDDSYHSQITPAMALEVRLIRASAANAEGNYREAQNLVSNDDLEAQTTRTANLLLIRADASFGLGQYSNAIGFYQRLIRIFPDSIRGLFGVAACEDHLGQYKEAIWICNTLIEFANESDSPLKLTILSASFNERGLAYEHLELFSKAITDFSKAIEIVKQSKPNDKNELNGDLWLLLLNRGNAYCESRQHSNSMADYNLAISISSSLKDERYYNSDLALALLLNGRGLDYIRQEQYSDAVGDLNNSVRILKSLDKSENPGLSNLLASALLNRAIAYRELGYITNSLNDCNQAINIWNQLIQAGAGELNIMLAKGLFNRADAFEGIQNIDNAIADFDKSVAIIEDSITKGHSELDYTYASVLLGRASLYSDFGNVDKALNNYNQAIAIFSIMIDRQRWDVADEFAKALANRGLAFARSDNSTNALADYNQSFVLWNVFIKHGHPDATNQFPPVLINRASTYVELNQTTNAIIDCLNAVSILESQVEKKPDLYKLLVMALILEGTTYDQMGQLTNAIDAYIRSEKVLQTLVDHGLPAMDDATWKTFANCGNDYWRIEQRSNSIICYTRAISVIRPLITNNPEIKNDLAKILKSRGVAFCADNNIGNAIIDIKDSLELISDGVEKEQSYIMLGMLFWIDDKTEASKTYLENGIRLNSDQKVTAMGNQFLSEIQTNEDLPKLRMQLMDTLKKSMH
jgi:tetratricopeptide (TPR) repeat protein